VRLSPRDRRGTLLGAGALALILVVYFLIDWAQTRAGMPEARENLTRLEARMRRLLGRREHLAEMYGPAANKPLEGTEAARIALLKTAQDLFRGSVQEPSYQPQPARAVQEAPGVYLLPLRLSGKCQLPQLAKCLSEMRKTDSLVFLDQITLSGNEKQPGQLEVTLVLATLARQEAPR
jgi:hypothetical protein